MVYLAIFICIFIVIAVIIYFLNTEIAVEYIRNGINDHVLISFSPVKGVKFKYEASLMGIRENGFKFKRVKKKKKQKIMMMKRVRSKIKVRVMVMMIFFQG